MDYGLECCCRLSQHIGQSAKTGKSDKRTASGGIVRAYQSCEDRFNHKLSAQVQGKAHGDAWSGCGRRENCYSSIATQLMARYATTGLAQGYIMFSHERDGEGTPEPEWRLCVVLWKSS